MADDPELAALRAKRMAELQQQMGGQDPAQMQQQQQQQMENAHREMEMRNAMLTQILDQSARARLNSIALVKPEKARMVENMLIQMARSGQVGGKVGETQLVGLLEKVQDKAQKTTVKFDRRRVFDSDDDDY
ncbi:predicted protein [Nematostella vectensis]|uniref:Programmed cell death protein 5 n=1 Tax=Nematostella vectensis TaxID=45351 RepID=A7S2W2_NEMVE|nr:programmed cell death protein 5 isoform X2 [Nematostella vectensis]EDO41998.1 predicted protein [Nematostella vectensis]|eukprot:XP_001634061.1 predicted protein [Nematostella vectensis]